MNFKFNIDGVHYEVVVSDFFDEWIGGKKRTWDLWEFSQNSAVKLPAHIDGRAVFGVTEADAFSLLKNILDRRRTSRPP